MLVSELIEWLRKQDQGATVEVLKREDAGWSGDRVRVVDLDVENHTCYTDFRGNRFAKGKPYENQRTLLLGED